MDAASIINDKAKDRELEYLSGISSNFNFRVERSETNVPMYIPEDVAFINTAELTKTADYFKKNGVYTKAHPTYDRSDYMSFWDREEHRCKEGMTVPGKLLPNGSIQSVHITGEHYGYLNYGQIKLTKDDKKYGSKEGEMITRYARKTAQKTVTFPDFWDGDYHYFKAKALARALGLNLIVGKARRKGYSYKNGWIAANRANLYPRSVTLLCAYDSASLYPEGTMQMANEYLQFLNKTTDWRKRRSRNSQDHIKFGYFLNDSSGIEYGFKSQILALSFGPAQPGVARGKDSDLVLVEETGKARNLLDFYKSTQPTLEDGIYSTGIMIFFGTGGGDSVLWEPFEKMFYNPELYRAISFKNEWDEGAEESHCSFFVPQWKNLPGFIDVHGNSLKEKAKAADKEERDFIQKNSEDPTDFETHVMEYCWSPSEGFSRSTNNIFTASIVSAHLNTLIRDKARAEIKRQGIIERDDDGELKLITNAQLREQKRYKLIHPSITSYPIKKGYDPYGCFTESVPRVKLGGKVPPIYRVWYDPFNTNKKAEDFNPKNSLASIYVYEVTNPWSPSKGDRIVGYYAGRPDTVDEAHRICVSIADYYGGYDGMILYENDDSGSFSTYCKIHKKTNLLAYEPEVAWNKDLQMNNSRNFGMSVNHPKRKQYGALYLKDWLFTPVTTLPSGQELLTIHYIDDIAFLRELLKWNLKGNFDRVSTMIIGMYDIKEQIVNEYITREPKFNVGIFDKPFF